MLGSGALITFVLSGVASLLARLPLLPCLLIIFLSPLVVGGVTLGITLLKEELDLINEKMEELGVLIKTIGCIAHVLVAKQEIEVLEKRREIILDGEDGKDISITTQLLTRRRPGSPINRFPVMLSTDRMKVSFADLNYKILTPNTAELLDHERLIIDDRLTRFIIHNQLKKALVYRGEPVEFAHRTVCDLDDPKEDWIGVEAGGTTALVSIDVWFPSDKWEVTFCQAYKGNPPLSQDVEDVPPTVGVGRKDGKDGKQRTYIKWQKAKPEPNQTYFIRWRATKRS